MAATASKIVRFGQKGLNSNVTAHSADGDSFVVFRDLFLDVAGRIRKRPGRGTTKGTIAGTEIQVLHEYTFTSSSGVATYHILGAIDGGGYVYRWNGTSWDAQTLNITVTAGGRWMFCNYNNRVFACNGKNEMIAGLDNGAGTIIWAKVGVLAPSVAPGYSLTAVANDPYTTGTVSVTNGSPTVTSSVGANWTGGVAWVGKRIAINGNNYTISSIDTGGGGGVPQVLTLTEGFKEATAAGLTYAIYVGAGDWENPPKYAFSYYNPTTGHVSNRSPIIEVTERDRVGRTITVTIAGAAENTTAYNEGYTQIQLFRTAKNANVLVALNEKLNNNSGGTSIVYTETAAKFLDTFLTKLEAPLTMNRRPPTGITSLAVWQSRMWGLKPFDATNGPRVYWTPTIEEVPFGVAEECWPAINSRRLDETTGLISLGSAAGRDALLIQTTRGDYSVRGFDNSDLTVYLLPTRESGGFQYGAVGVAGEMVQFYRDKRLLVNGQDDADSDLGREIQDKLDSVKDSIITKARLFRFAAKNMNYLMLSVPKNSSSTANDYTYIFDLDRRALYEWNFGITAAATIHDNGALKLWIGDAAGAVYELLPAAIYTDSGANYQPTFKTCVIKPFGDDAAAIWRYCKVYVSNAALAYSLTYYVNEESAGTTVSLVAADHRLQSANGKEFIFTPSGHVSAQTFQFEMTFAADAGDVQIESTVFGFDPDQAQDGNVGFRA